MDARNADVTLAGDAPHLVTFQIGAFRADAVKKGAQPASVRTVAAAVDPAAIRQKPEAPFREAKQAVDLSQAERIVSVGRLVPHKQVDQLIAAMPEIARRIPDVELHIVGDGTERAALTAKLTGSEEEPAGMAAARGASRVGATRGDKPARGSPGRAEALSSPLRRSPPALAAAPPSAPPSKAPNTPPSSDATTSSPAASPQRTPSSASPPAAARPTSSVPSNTPAPSVPSPSASVASTTRPSPRPPTSHSPPSPAPKWSPAPPA